jgi:hypothetical protein
MSNSTANGNGNGNKSSYAAAAGISTADHAADPEATLINAPVVAPAPVAPPNVGEQLDVKSVERKKTRRGTLLKVAAFLIGLCILSVLGLYFFMADGSGTRTVKTTVTNKVNAGQPASDSDDKLTADAIAKLRSQVAPTPAPGLPGAPPPPQPGTQPAIIVQQTEPVVPTRVGTTTVNANPNTDPANTPVVHPADGVAGTVATNASPNANTAAATAPHTGAGTESARARTTAARSSRANAQKSLVFGEDVTRTAADAASDNRSAVAQARVVNGGFALGTTGNRAGELSALPPRPAFGALLPVRTLGALYTLRTGALVRMELTRDSAGPGWRLPRHTVIVGTLRGGEVDRAYVSIVGYIDANSARLVTFGGSLLGADAGEGIKGERRQVTSRWSRIFGTLAERGYALAQTALGRRNGATIVLGNAAQPELDALTRNGDRREFVAVQAGSMGYVSVTDLPREVQGIDTLAQMSPDALAQLLNSGASTGTGLTDDEVAQLLSAGSPAQIRTAMPRMNESMRRIAEQVLDQSDR